MMRRQGILSGLSGDPANARSRLFTRQPALQGDSKELLMVTAAVILSFVISIVLVLVAISQIDA